MKKSEKEDPNYQTEDCNETDDEEDCSKIVKKKQLKTYNQRVTKKKPFGMVTARTQRRRTKTNTDRVCDEAEAFATVRKLNKKYPATEEDVVSNLDLLVLIKKLRLSFNQARFLVIQIITIILIIFRH